MKTNILLLSMLAVLCCGLNQASAQVDLVPGINYSYNPPGANGIIQVVNEDVCNNLGGSAGQFDIMMYIYNTGTNHPYVVADSTFSGISGNACGTINNWNININNTPGIPAGTYKLGEWVNYQHMVTETDTTNNAGLFSGSWTYTPDAVNEVNISDVTMKVSPNPSNGKFVLQSAGKGFGSFVEIYNVLGEKTYSSTLFTINSPLSIDISNQPKGMYFYKVLSEEGTYLTGGKLIIN